MIANLFACNTTTPLSIWSVFASGVGAKTSSLRLKISPRMNGLTNIITVLEWSAYSSRVMILPALLN